MLDKFGREIDYLRISVTDRCDFRCTYCMPEAGVCKQSHLDILSFEEIEEIARAAVSLGIKKIRVTGGEPLVRQGIVRLCAALAAIPGVLDLSLTTNAALLADKAQALRDAGVCRVNISLDTLNAAKFRQITRCGELSDTLSGIRAAVLCGMDVKLNCVLIGGVNDDEIPDFVELSRHYPFEVRFIELMPIGGAAYFGEEAFLPCSVVPKRVPELRPAERTDGVARLFALPRAAGTVGLISPLSDRFCACCNRIRLTSDGKLKPCLHSSEEIPVRGLHGEALLAALRTAIMHKPAQHIELSGTEASEAGRSMNQIGG
ncbi:MAG: GTP 3',8-cyclase MoaA [Oscillospiraceae bacterium]